MENYEFNPIKDYLVPNSQPGWAVTLSSTKMIRHNNVMFCKTHYPLIYQFFFLFKLNFEFRVNDQPKSRTIFI